MFFSMKFLWLCLLMIFTTLSLTTNHLTAYKEGHQQVLPFLYTPGTPSKKRWIYFSSAWTQASLVIFWGLTWQTGCRGCDTVTSLSLGSKKFALLERGDIVLLKIGLHVGREKPWMRQYGEGSVSSQLFKSQLRQQKRKWSLCGNQLCGLSQQPVSQKWAVLMKLCRNYRNLSKYMEAVVWSH